MDIKSTADRLFQSYLDATATEDLKAAEDGLANLSMYPGFGTVLIGYLDAKPQLNRSIRQLAAVLLRRNVFARHWYVATSEHSEKAVGTDKFIVPDAEKSFIRNSLPRLLADPDVKVRGLTASVLGDIGSSDWPEEWPELLDGLKSLLTPPTSGNLESVTLDEWLRADGALEAMVTMIQDLGSEEITKVSTLLIPSVFNVCSISEQQGGSSLAFIEGMKTRAFDCLREFLSSLSSLQMETKTKKLLKALIPQFIPPLLSVVGQALSSPYWHPTCALMKSSAFSCISMLIQQFSEQKPVQQLVSTILPSSLRFFQAAIAEYVRVRVDGCAPCAAPALQAPNPALQALFDLGGLEEDAEQALDSLSIALSHFCMIFSGASVQALPRALAPYAPGFVAALLAAAQISEQSLEEWAESPENYLAAENDDSVEMSARKDAEDALRDVFECDEPILSRAVASALSAGVVAAIDVASSPEFFSNDSVRSKEFVPFESNPVEHMKGLLIGSPRLLSRFSPWKVVESAVFVFGGVSQEFSQFLQFQNNSTRRNRSKQAEPLTVAMQPAQMASHLLGILKTGTNTPLIATARLSQYPHLSALISALDVPPFSVEAEPVQLAPYLLGRCLWCAAKLASTLSPSDCGNLLSAALEGIQPSHALPIRMAASSSLSRLLRHAPEDVVAAAGPTILERIGLLLENALGASSTGEEPSKANEGKLEGASYLIDLLLKTLALAPQAVNLVLAQRLIPFLLRLFAALESDPVLAPNIATAIVLLVKHDDAQVRAVAAAGAWPAFSTLLVASATRIEQLENERLASISNSSSSTPIPRAVHEDEAVSSTVLCSAVQLLTAVVSAQHETFLQSQSQSPKLKYMSPPQELKDGIRAAAVLLAFGADEACARDCARALTSSLRAFGPNILSSGVLTVQLLHSAISRLVDPHLASDGTAVTLAPLALVAVRHLFVASSPADWSSNSESFESVSVVAGLLMDRAAVSRLPSTQLRLLTAVSYLIQLSATPGASAGAENKMVQFLMQKRVTLPSRGPLAAASIKSQLIQSTPSNATGDIVLVSTLPALTLFGLMIVKYFDLAVDELQSRAICLALALILSSSAREHLALTLVNGELVDTAAVSGAQSTVASRTRGSRSRTKTELKETEVPLSVRLLTLYVRFWFSQWDSVVNGGVDGLGEEDEDEEVEELVEREDDDEDDDDVEEEEDEEGSSSADFGDIGSDSSRRIGRSPYADADAFEAIMSSPTGDDRGREMSYLSDLLGGGHLNGKNISDLLGGDEDDEEDDGPGDDDQFGLSTSEFFALKGLLEHEKDAESSASQNGLDPLVARLTPENVTTEGSNFLNTISMVGATGQNQGIQSLLSNTMNQLKRNEQVLLQKRLSEQPPSLHK